MITIRQTYFNSDFEFEQLVELQNIVYPNRKRKFSVERFKFWYKDNPCGHVISVNAFDEDKMVAHYACIPVEMIISGKVVKGIHSMATVTHPNYRGRGLFKMLARKTYEVAEKEGFEFVSGVANANSFMGFIKHLGFYKIDNLDVKWGWGEVINTSSQKLCYGYWPLERLNWRLKKCDIYSKNKKYVYGRYGFKYCVKTLMCVLEKDITEKIKIKKSGNRLNPLNLYIGLGADLSRGYYYNFPKFIKHSPFNLIFKDLTNGTLPHLNKDNIFFQLIDFDVA